MGAAGRVTPDPGRIDDEGAVGTQCVGLRNEARRTVHIGDGERAAGAEHRIGFGQVRHTGAEHGRIVGAEDPHCRGSPTERAVTQSDRVGEAIRQVPARSKTLELSLEGTG